MIPSEIRSHLGLRGHTQLVIEVRDDEIVLIPVVTEQITKSKEDDGLGSFLSSPG